MLTLVFSPFFDQKVWMGKEKVDYAILGKKYVGKMGLLGELELRLGLTHPEGCGEGRFAKWYEALKKADMQNPALFFHRSFQNDPIGTAKILFQWREALVGAGWKLSKFYDEDSQALNSYGLALNDSRTVAGLATVEKKFELLNNVVVNPGMPDRWMAVYEELSKGQDEPLEVSVQVAGTEAVLEASEPLLHRILLLMNKNRSVLVGYDDHIAENPKQNRILLEAPDKLEACQWLLAGDYQNQFPELYKAVQAGQVLVVDGDSAFLDGVLASLGKPAVEDSGMDVNNAILGLFKNGIGQFRLPVDLKGLVNYLSSPYHPLNLFKKAMTDRNGNSYELSLKSALKKYLSRQHGFGLSHNNETWDSLMSSTDFKMVPNSPFTPADLTGFWKTGVSQVDNNGVCVVDTQAVKEYCTCMSVWCREAQTNNATVREQLRLVGSFFDSMKQILDMENVAQITWPELAKRVSAITTNAPYLRKEEALGSICAVREPSAVAEKLECPLVWLDAYEKDGRPYEYDFLIRSSIEVMNGNSMFIPFAEAIGKSCEEAEKRGLAMADTIYAIWPHKDSGHLCQKHRIFTFAQQNGVGITSLENWCLEKPVVKSVESADTRKEEYVNVNVITPDMFPAKESATSLEVLFNSPFKYVLQYLFNVQEPDTTRLSTIKGSVAHLLIHDAFDEISAGKGQKEMSWQELENWCSVDFEEKLDCAVMAEGAELLLPENRSEFVSFKTTLQNKSLPCLIDLMRENKLVMVGSESKLNDQVYLTDPSNHNQLCGLCGSIDCIMRDEQGNPIIFDFKWTESKTALQSREDEVKEDNALQLCIYRHALEQMLSQPLLEGVAAGARVRGIGYYMLNQGNLITTCNLFQSASHVSYHAINVNHIDLLQRICNLYIFRKDQLLSGLVEEAEGIKDSNVDYLKEIVVDSTLLFHIKGLKQKKSGWSLTKESIYNAYAAMRGNLK